MSESEKLAFVQKWATYYWRKAYVIHGAKLGAMPVIEISRRMTKSGGMAYMNIKGYAPPKYEVARFSSKLLGMYPDTYAKDTIPHELAHFIAYRIYGEENHGAMFYHVGGELGVVLTRCHSMNC